MRNMKKVLILACLVASIFASCTKPKHNDLRISEDTIDTVTTSQTTGNWYILSETYTLSTGYFHQPDSTVISFYDQSYLVLNASFEPTLHTYSLDIDTIFNVNPIFYNASNINYMGIKVNATDDTMILYNFEAADTVVLLKVR